VTVMVRACRERGELDHEMKEGLERDLGWDGECMDRD
jgi:hypothetical protein